MTDLIPVLKCDRQSVPLADLLQVVGVSRQYFCVHCNAEDGGVLGSIWIKSGFVVGADAGVLTGRRAFLALLVDPAASSFSVYRPRKALTSYPKPLGSIAELMLDAAEEAEQDLPAPAVPEAGSGAEKPAADPMHGRVVAFASAKGGVGKTTLALNVALAFAEAGQAVLLVDADPLGGIGHSLAGQDARLASGVYDVLLGRKALGDVVLTTKVPALQILPAGSLSPQEALQNLQKVTDAETWRALFEPLVEPGRLVIVDLPAGLHGIAHAVLGACTHAFAILAAEPLALRVVPQLLHSLEELPGRRAPATLAGVILNNVQFRTGASIGVVQGAWASFAQGLVLETTVPRDTAFLEASAAGVPVAFLDRVKRPPVAAVFRHLADDIAERIGLYEVKAAGEPVRLL